jgi:hypothetical protein
MLANFGNPVTILAASCCICSILFKNDSPLYLYDCLLPFIREENELNLRSQTEFRNPFTRLQLFANSFFPSTNPK